ncbi:hypothetical protein NX059_006465 [Plenodomus lindquistii]|nr:hypothetical protein NX059_006465 [Plenodomus lindquistii]
MGKRDRVKGKLRALLASDAARPAPAPTNSPLTRPTSTTPTPSTAPNVNASAATSHGPILEKALGGVLAKLPQAEKAAFTQASAKIDEHTLLVRVKTYDAEHMNDSAFRPHTERLSKFLNLLNKFMRGVAIGIQASPEVSALVVGSLRVVIDLGLQFAMYFSKLTDMMCTFEDYLGPLAEYAKAADISLVETAVVKAYANIVEFSWKACRVFVDANGNKRKWTSLRAFMRQHWETFESEFAAIKGDLQLHLDVLLHSVQSLHFDQSRRGEEARRREQERQEKTEFLAWVSNIDFEQTHQVIYAKKQEKTCDWLIKDPRYQQWFNSPNSSLLWCHGKPGIGKSVLASNVIENITAEIGLREDAAVCFAYYNYRDAQLKDLHQIVTALLKQLIRRKPMVPHGLLKNQHDALSPSLVGTLDSFKSCVEDLSQVYVVFDALDECPEEEREEVLKFITKAVTAQVACHVKVFVTSRKEMDIAKAFENKKVPTIPIQTESVTADIETFVRSQVEKLLIGEHGKTLYVTDGRLKETIIQTLAQRAEGMFLWVNLQLDSLCQASKARKDHVVASALETLPQGLTDTYVRILERIEAQSPYMRNLALNCLTWTIYARRPLRTSELQHALAIGSDSTTFQDLDTDQVILEACCNLLEVINFSIRPVHYTVQEFLTETIPGLSEQSIRGQLQDSTSAHRRLSLACMAYIRQSSFDAPARKVTALAHRLGMNPLAGYACHSFDYHVSKSVEHSPDVMDQLGILLQKESTYLAAILQIRIFERDAYMGGRDRFNPLDFLVSAETIIYTTSLYNIAALRQRWIVQTLPAYALQLAASAGLENAVHRLLEEGYDINEKDGTQSTALYHACSNGHNEIAQILIEQRADVNAQGGYFGYALQAASFRGHEQIVKTLLNNAANANAQGGYYGYALQAASFRGHEQIVKTLLNNAANANAQGGYYSNALQAALLEGHEQIVKTLLNNGANVNAQGGYYGNALQAASYGGREQIVKTLLNNGANANAQGGYYGNALQAASLEGHEQIVKTLLNNGANVNAQGGYYGNALQAASYRGREQIVKTLLNNGANANAQGGYYGNALQAASLEGHEQIVKTLLNNGANVNAQGGYYGNALQAASYGGREQIVKTLLNNGANANAQGGYYGNALQAASYGGHEQIVNMLLDNNADINALGGQWGNALQAAVIGNEVQIVKILLERNADANAEHGGVTVLQDASEYGDVEIVKMLLDKKADVNRDGRRGTALQLASDRGHHEVVKMLLDEGADVHAKGHYGWDETIHGTALQAASRNGHEQVVQMLLEAGAEDLRDKDDASSSRPD